jgi:hypothetical protein
MYRRRENAHLAERSLKISSTLFTHSTFFTQSTFFPPNPLKEWPFVYPRRMDAFNVPSCITQKFKFPFFCREQGDQIGQIFVYCANFHLLGEFSPIE